MKHPSDLEPNKLSLHGERVYMRCVGDGYDQTYVWPKALMLCPGGKDGMHGRGGYEGVPCSVCGINIKPEEVPDNTGRIPLPSRP